MPHEAMRTLPNQFASECRGAITPAVIMPGRLTFDAGARARDDRSGAFGCGTYKERRIEHVSKSSVSLMHSEPALS
jgi:hypothetical protein